MILLVQAQNVGIMWLIITNLLGVAIGIVALTYSYNNQKQYRGGIIGRSHKYTNIAITLFIAAFIWHILDISEKLPEDFAARALIPELMTLAGIIFIAGASRLYSKMNIHLKEK